MEQKLLCPKCNCECERYGHYNSIGRCPQCGGLWTTKDGEYISTTTIKFNGGD